MKFFAGLLQLFKPKYLKILFVTVVVVILVMSSLIAWRLLFPEGEFFEQLNDTEAESTRFTLTNADRDLFQAVRDNNMKEVLRSLREGGRADAINERGATPLLAAVALNRVDMIPELIASERTVDKVNSILVYAIVQNRPEIVKELMKWSSDINSFDKNGYTPLLYAVTRNNVNVARELLNAGADVNAQSRGGVTPLIAAVSVGRPDIVAELLRAGADVDILSPSGETAMSIARNRSRQVIIALLAEAEASAN